MYIFFVILIVIASLLMIGIVLIQESKGGGLSSNFASSNQIMGVRKTTDFVEKATWGLAIAMVVLSVFCAYSTPKNEGERSSVQDMTQPVPAANTGVPVSAPGASADANAAAPAKEGAAAPAKEGAAAPAKEGAAAPAKEGAAAPAKEGAAAPAEKPAK